MCVSVHQPTCLTHTASTSFHGLPFRDGMGDDTASRRTPPVCAQLLAKTAVYEGMRGGRHDRRFGLHTTRHAVQVHKHVHGVPVAEVSSHCSNER